MVQSEKSISIIHQILIEWRKSFDIFETCEKFLYLYMIKTLSKAGREVSLLNLVKVKYWNTTAKIIPDEEILDAFTLM